jgi:hypothetical protein
MLCNLAKRDPDFAAYFRGFLFSTCCYAAGVYSKKSALREGESEVTFVERMETYLRTYFVALQVFGDAPDHPYGGFQTMWSWIARILNQPAKYITPSLLESFLRVCGHAMLEKYRNQFRKLMHFIETQYFQRLSADVKSTLPSAIGRVKTILETYRRTETFE